MSLISIGIDNGLTGAVVAVDQDMAIIYWRDTPVLTMGKGAKRQYDEGAMCEILESITTECVLSSHIQAWIEHAQAFPKQGSTSNFRTGEGYGLWKGICAALNIPRQIVHPRSWTKQMHRDAPKGDPKKRSIWVCQRLFPDFPVTGPRGGIKDGRADAALIAVYGLRQMLGER